MRFHQRIFHLVVLVLFIPTAGLYGQANASKSDFAAYMDSAEAHLEKAQYYDRLQYKYAEDFFHYFLQNPNSTIGQEALKDACMMWISIGESQKLIKALDRISIDSDAWYDILRLIGSSYAFNQNKFYEYKPTLEKLEKNATNPRTRTAALFLLADEHRRKDNPIEVKKLFHEIIKLDADTFYVKQARSYIHETEKLGIGQTAPPFETTTINGKGISLKNQMNKLVILDFWATWCGPCIREIPTLQMLRTKYPKEELQIIGISLDKDGKKLNEFLDNHVMDWPQIRQSKSYDDKLSKLYNVQGLPKTLLIDGKGKIIAKNIRGEHLTRKIAELLGK